MSGGILMGCYVYFAPNINFKSLLDDVYWLSSFLPPTTRKCHSTQTGPLHGKDFNPPWCSCVAAAFNY